MDIYKRLVKNFNIGTYAKESNEQKIKESALVLIPLYIAPLGIIWGFLYIYLDHWIPSLIPLFYALSSALSLLHFKKTGNINLFQRIQMTLILFLPFFLMWSLGGFTLGSFVFIWAFFAPVSALTYENSKHSLYWFYAFIALVVFSTLIDQHLFESHTTFMPQAAIEMFFLLNISAALCGVYFLIKYYINEKEKNAHELLKQEHKKLLRRTKELSEANDKLQYLANHDTLTTLPNRNYLREHLSKILAHAKRHKYSVALLFMDLDGFKQINDNFGHAVGDKLLQDVSSRIKSTLREEDEVARLGGDEFAIVIGDITNTTHVEMISERIIDEINRDYDFLPYNSPIGASIGISLFPEDADDIDTLINNADKAMYRVKQSSKNSYLFYSVAKNSDS